MKISRGEAGEFMKLNKLDHLISISYSTGKFMQQDFCYWLREVNVSL